MRLPVLALLLLFLPLATLPADGTRARESDLIGRQTVPATPAFLAAHSAPAAVATLPETDGRGPLDRAATGSTPMRAGAIGGMPPSARRSGRSDWLPPRLCERLPYDATAPPATG